MLNFRFWCSRQIFITPFHNHFVDTTTTTSAIDNINYTVRIVHLHRHVPKLPRRPVIAMRWTGFCIVPLLLHSAATSVAGCCDAKDVQPAAYRSYDLGASPGPLVLRSVISRALSRARESTHDRRLAGDLWLETVDSNRRNALTLASGTMPDDLVAQADAVFDNHRLSWRDAIVRGLDLHVFKDREQQRYVLGVTQHSGDSRNSGKYDKLSLYRTVTVEIDKFQNHFN